MNTSLFKPNGPLLWSATSIVLIVLVLVSTMPPLLVAAFGFGPGDPELETMLDSLMTEHDEMMTTYQARFNGRSVFYTPPPTPKPVVRKPRPSAPAKLIKTVAEPTPAEDPISPTYTGPSIMAIFGEEVWFAGSGYQKGILRITVGEEKNDIRIVATDPPWSATVQYKNGEYEVSLFEVKDLGFDEPLAEIIPPEGATVRMTKPGDDPEEKSPATSDKTQTTNDTSGDSVSKSPLSDAEKSDAKKDTTGNDSQAPGGRNSS